MFGFPLLLIPLAIFNIIVFLMPEVSFTAGIFVVPLLSGTLWTATLGDLLIAIGLLLVLFEVVRAARAGGRYLTDHLLSLLVLAGAVAEFVALTPFGNSTFFLLCALAFVDFFSGIALHRRRSRATPAGPPAVEPAAPPPPREPPPLNPVPASPAPPPPVAEAPARLPDPGPTPPPAEDPSVPDNPAPEAPRPAP